MTSVVVLGAGGMLGSMVTRVLKDRDLEVIEVGRPGGMAGPERMLDAVAATEREIEEAVRGGHYIVNAIGLVKQLIDESARSQEQAILINSLFPRRLARVAEATGAHVIQIETDCVFSGRRGGYVETDPHDALDTYGKTKSLGEVVSDKVTHLRCSIVGLEPVRRVALLSWLMGHAHKATVTGYRDHHWNGVTTYHFARLCHGIVAERADGAASGHVVPADAVTKATLLRLLAKHYDRPDLAVAEADSGHPTDRTLATLDIERNIGWWKSAGYPGPIPIDEMIAEAAEHDARASSL